MTPGVKDWPNYLRQAYEYAQRNNSLSLMMLETDYSNSYLKPGGYIECQELHCPIGYKKDNISDTPFMVQYVRQRNSCSDI